MSSARDEGYVYLIGEVGSEFVKIGFAEEPKNRLSQLQIGNPRLLALLARFPHPAARLLERSLHTHFADRIQRGEWYRLGADPVSTVEQAITIVFSAPHREVQEPVFTPGRGGKLVQVDPNIIAKQVEAETAKQAHLLMMDMLRKWRRNESTLSTREILTRLDDLWGRVWSPESAPRELANLLRRYDIRPVKIRVGASTMQGYRRSDFADHWDTIERMDCGDEVYWSGARIVE